MNEFLNLLGKDNAVVSPYSIVRLLALLVHGTKGTLKAKLEAFTQSIPTLTPSKDIFESIDSVWQLPHLEFNPDFLKALSKLGIVPQFTTTANPINKWADEATHGMIPSLFDKLPPNFLAGFFNATYFKGDWKTPFEKKNTKEAKFNNLDGSFTKIKYLNGNIDVASCYKYNTTYGMLKYEGGSVAFFVIPDLGSFKNKTPLEYYNESSRVPYAYGQAKVKIPKLTLSSDWDLNKDLTNLGLGNLLSTGFKPSKEKALISSIAQKAKLELDEKGTKAAAVTTAIYASCCAFSESPVDIIADRPFYLFIVKDKTPIFGASVVKG